MTSKKRKQNQEIHFKLKFNASQYSKYYKTYMLKEYPTIEILVKKIVQLPFCRQHYLKYPLDGLLRGVCKKMLINVFELTILGYFLSQVEWKLDHYIYSALSDVFPNVIHVNEPTDSDKLKQLSMFLYFSSYSIKQFLNEDVTMYRQQMIKIFPQFEHIQNNWTSTQQTVGQILNPRLLNKFFQQAHKVKTIADYNFCIDKILQISPCYDITSKMQKGKQVLNFGYMEMNRQNEEIGQFHMHNSNVADMYFQNNDHHQHQIKMQDIDLNDFKEFDGEI